MATQYYDKDQRGNPYLNSNGEKVTYSVSRLLRGEDTVEIPRNKILFCCSAEYPLEVGSDATMIGLIGLFAESEEDVVNIFNSNWGKTYQYDGCYVPLKRATDFERTLTVADSIHIINRE